ncbi:hypothetical protein [Pedobacter jamesrossensis]|uniref:Uncharacterized protein n=1 Tax=Pedobacter jamesrossensis TaxID=1908238 RepID=A0ABV8NN32_9SPHI
MRKAADFSSALEALAGTNLIKELLKLLFKKISAGFIMMLKRVQHEECIMCMVENSQRLNAQLKTYNLKHKTFYLNPLILRNNCSTFAVRFMGYLQGSRGSGKIIK